MSDAEPEVVEEGEADESVEPEEPEVPDEPDEESEGGTQEIEGGVTEDPDIGGCTACEDIDEADLLVVYDENYDFPWKSGNPYARVCPGCGSQTFTARSYWESQEVPYVIPKGEDEPKPLFGCPYDDCDGEFLGFPDGCPECERELEWEE